MNTQSIKMKDNIISPVFVPSKGRSNPKFLQLIPEAILVVEPQDVEVYKAANPNTKILVLGENDRGIAYVRQSILDYARQSGIQTFWQIDDDVSILYENVNGKTVKVCPYYALHSAERDFINWGSGLGGLEYSQYCWGKLRSEYAIGYCEVVSFFDVKQLMNINYRNLQLKEDRDLSMQVVASGLKATRIRRFGFFCPPNGSNSGGLKPLYDKNYPEIDACKKIVNLWGQKYCNIKIKRDGRIDLKINWRRLATASTSGMGKLPQEQPVFPNSDL